jgi:hypothetical protein
MNAKLEISKIRLDGGTQPRAALNVETIGEYSERMKGGDPFPPVDVFFDGTNYWLADGFHRIGAARRLGVAEIEANLYQGSLEDAKWHSYSVNTTHGMHRTKDDKERAVHATLQHPNAANLSNVEIAKHCGVSEGMVRKYRSEKKISASSKNTKMRTVTRSGKTYRQNTANIGMTKSESSKRNKRGKISRNANIPTLEPTPGPPMIPLQLCPDNPQTAAATLIQHFSRQFLETLIRLISDHLNTNGE